MRAKSCSSCSTTMEVSSCLMTQSTSFRVLDFRELLPLKFQKKGSKPTKLTSQTRKNSSHLAAVWQMQCPPSCYGCQFQASVERATKICFEKRELFLKLPPLVTKKRWFIGLNYLRILWVQTILAFKAFGKMPQPLGGTGPWS